MSEKGIPVFVDPWDEEGTETLRDENLSWNGIQFVGEVNVEDPDKRLGLIRYFEQKAGAPTRFTVMLRSAGMVDYPEREKEFRMFEKDGKAVDLFEGMTVPDLQKKLEEGWQPEPPPLVIDLASVEYYGNLFMMFSMSTYICYEDKDTGRTVKAPLRDITDFWDMAKHFRPSDLERIGVTREYGDRYACI